jgi:hypothetical protein
MTVTVCRSGQLTLRSGRCSSRPALGDLVKLTTRHLKKGDKIRLNGLGILQVRKGRHGWDEIQRLARR